MCLIAIQFDHKFIPNSTTQGFTCVKVCQLPHSCPVFMTMPAFERTWPGIEELAMGEWQQPKPLNLKKSRNYWKHIFDYLQWSKPSNGTKNKVLSLGKSGLTMSHPCQYFLGCRKCFLYLESLLGINLKEKTLKKCSWPFHWKSCTCFQLLFTTFTTDLCKWSLVEKPLELDLDLISFN